jgi:hypothetical protein
MIFTSSLISLKMNPSSSTPKPQPKEGISRLGFATNSSQDELYRPHFGNLSMELYNLEDRIIAALIGGHPLPDYDPEVFGAYEVPTLVHPVPPQATEELKLIESELLLNNRRILMQPLVSKGNLGPHYPDIYKSAK